MAPVVGKMRLLTVLGDTRGRFLPHIEHVDHGGVVGGHGKVWERLNRRRWSTSERLGFRKLGKIEQRRKKAS
jgi:hypothetical protein